MALAINKPFECRSAVVLLSSFRPMPEGYIPFVVGPSFYAAKGKTAGKELEEAWQP
jgi:hypothetical protein